MLPKTPTPYPNPQQYRQIAGSLQYLTLTRPDISLAINRVCQFMHKPLNQHFQLLKRILQYVQGTLHYGLPIFRSHLSLTAFSNSDWAGDHTDRKSTTSYCVFLGQTLISWCAKKQTVVARSSTEAEYRALTSAATEIIWLRRLLTDFDINTNTPTPIYCDNISAIALANNPIYHARTKHIEIDQHFIRACIQDNTITVHHINSTDQPADIFTKSLATNRFQLLRDKLTIHLNDKLEGA